MKRLWFITRKWPPASGGMERYSVEISRELSKNVALRLIALPGRKNGRVPSGFSVLYFGMKTAARIVFSRKPPDYILVGDLAQWPFAALAQLRSSVLAVAIAGHGTDVTFAFQSSIFSRFYGLYLRLGTYFLKSKAILIANSDFTKDEMIRAGLSEVMVIPLAGAREVRLDRTSVTPRRSIFFGDRLIEQKGCAWFVRTVLPALHAKGMRLRVAGPLQDPKQAAILNAPGVDYLGLLDTETLQREYAAALTVIVPSRQGEGFGLVASEAVANGGVVVASDLGGLRHAISNGITGFLEAPDDPDAWIRRINSIDAWSPEQRAVFLKRLYDSISADATWARVAADTIKALQARAENAGKPSG